MASPHGGAGRGVGGANRPGEAPKVAAQRLREARQNLALVVDASGRAELVQRPIPMPGPKQLLIKVETVLVQPTCVGLASGQLLPPSGTSLIPGQEFCGSIQELGSNVDKEIFAEGKKVAVSPISFCDTCYFCLRGQTNLCEIGAELLGWDLDGGYQQYVCVSAKRCHVFDHLVSMRQAVLASSAAAASYGMTRVTIQPGDTVLILGSSVTALMGVAFARGLGAEYICVVGLKGSDPQKALNCGASKHIPWDPLADEAQQFATVSFCRAAAPYTPCTQQANTLESLSHFAKLHPLLLLFVPLRDVHSGPWVNILPDCAPSFACNLETAIECHS
jgi:D-arabinose 1-dehydrogenase-like Zn-dependent alcohol dehydrogenase